MCRIKYFNYWNWISQLTWINTNIKYELKKLQTAIVEVTQLLKGREGGATWVQDRLYPLDISNKSCDRKRWDVQIVVPLYCACYLLARGLCCLMYFMLHLVLILRNRETRQKRIPHYCLSRMDVNACVFIHNLRLDKLLTKVGKNPILRGLEIVVQCINL